MSIVSFRFLFFLLIFLFLYYISPRKAQWGVLLIGSLVFYAFSGWQYLFFILSCAFFTWFAALQIDGNTAALKSALASTADKNEKNQLREQYGQKKHLWISAALILTLGVWIVLKYGPMLLDSFTAIFNLPQPAGGLKFIVPLGMSFYTFDAIGYMIDVSRGKYGAEKNFFKYLTFVSYFPHIIQGPFSRFDTLGKTLFTGHKLSFEKTSTGFERILWGYFKKLLIADKLAIPVSEIFSNYQNYNGFQILFVMFLYGIQLYADFSGYIDIVSGISHILGIELEQNFRQPYFSVSVEEFWRRWHMTLGHWFRDYLFYPVYRSKRAGKIRKQFPPEISKHLISFMAMFWVWSASGLWHGANWTFLIWGWLNMAVMWLSLVLDPLYRRVREFLHISLKNKIWNAFRMLRTFCIVCFLLLFIRADSIEHAIKMIRQIGYDFNPGLVLTPLKLFPGLESHIIVVILASSIILLFVSILNETGKWVQIREQTPFPVKDLVCVLLITALILFAGNAEDVAKNFIYANF
ncbi:MAG: MBOAT family protein [Anaerolineaceae bacterium]|nr:MBOAT family protein [Anaerolineaceae bacterium]